MKGSQSYENLTVARQTQWAMGTVMTHQAFGRYAQDSLEAVCREVGRIEGLLSRFLPESDIYRMNQSAGVKSEKVHPETFEVLSKAVEFSQWFQGCFDVTIEPLVALWKINQETFAEPEEASIESILKLVNYRDLTLNPREMTAGLRNAGQSVDLGGIGKGFAGDRILEVFKEFGITSAYSNLGGNVVTLGTKPDGSAWRVGIQHPRQENGILGAVSVAGQTVVTSGDYQRFSTGSSGKRYHHILDPRSGYPTQSGVISVTVVTENSMAADALSTALFVAGMQKGLEFLKRFPETDAVFVDTDLQVYVTPGLEYRFQTDQGIGVTILK